ncbi:LysR family transcriptional regulator [Shewanella sp. 202IG2-18]|uniref:LysR family transcriptional regulator n=1 Tax=Parashewanella hymeniacidonis TaxID=2807618 RepID=UPI00195F94B1|nr:LysR family transcriptional regulator [Parashewanella hymeniacidonis]MBM7071715.1 LysR family transcriptional regulator [Parashewanella hymeniacidonis]
MKTTIGNLSNIDLRLLRVFKRIVEAHGISAAERSLNIGRSTISRHLKELEHRLGVVLCYRGRSGFKLTEEGLTIYHAINTLLDSLDEFCQRVNQINHELKGKLIIGIFDNMVTNPNCQFHTVLNQYYQLAPAVHIEIHVLPTVEIEQGILEGKIHFGVLPCHNPTNSLCYLPLFSEEMTIFCGVTHPLANNNKAVTKEALLDYSFAGLAFSSTNNELLTQNNLMVSASAYAQDGVALLILTGNYLGFLPRHFGSVFVERHQMFSLSPTPLDYCSHFSGIFRFDSKNDRKIKQLIEIIKAYS